MPGLRKSGIRSLGTAFQGAQITAFNELEKFTGITSIIQQSNGKGVFNGSTIKKFQFPGNLKNLDYGGLTGCKPNMDSIVVPTSCTKIYSFGVMTGGYIGRWIIRHKMITFAPGTSNCGSFKASNKPAWVLDYPEVQPFGSGNSAGGNNYFYVPDDLVDAYKADSRWSTAVNNIFPISELPD